MKSFAKSDIMRLRAEIAAALKQVGIRTGVAFDIGTIRYTAGNARMTLTAVSTDSVFVDAPGGAPTEVTVPQRLQWMIENHNLVRTKAGKTLVDYDPRKHKYPFIYTKLGKRYKTSQANALLMFSENPFTSS